MGNCISCVQRPSESVSEYAGGGGGEYGLLGMICLLIFVDSFVYRAERGRSLDSQLDRL